jgi:protein CpxP
MKKLCILFAFALPFISWAQRPHEKTKLTPEQRTTLQVKQMELALTLSEDQVKAVRKVLENHVSKTEMKIETETAPLTSEQRYEKQIAQLDRKIAIQNSMKSILNESQFEQWKKSFSAKRRPVRAGKGKRPNAPMQRGAPAQRRKN